VKTLIAYASKTGTTEKAAQMIAEKLNEAPDMINIGAAKKIDLSGYDFVLVGGPIKMGRLYKPVRQFLAMNQAVLASKRFGLFVACGYPQELDNYIKVTLDDAMRAHAEVLTDIGYAYNLENMGPIEQRVVMQLAGTQQSIEAYKPEAIQKIADVINAN
jgi:menaquinone-dependent protoporphyrinogen oxidase